MEPAPIPGSPIPAPEPPPVTTPPPFDPSARPIQGSGTAVAKDRRLRRLSREPGPPRLLSDIPSSVVAPVTARASPRSSLDVGGALVAA
jgi:hypothetical protein